MTDAALIFQPVIDTLWTGVGLIMAGTVVLFGLAAIRLNLVFGLLVTFSGSVAFAVMTQHALSGPFSSLGWAAPIFCILAALGLASKTTRY